MEIEGFGWFVRSELEPTFGCRRGWVSFFSFAVINPNVATLVTSCQPLFLQNLHNKIP